MMILTIKLAAYVALALCGAAVTKAPIEQPKAPIEQREAPTIYMIHGVAPEREWQEALRDELKQQGIEWYMSYAVCQIFQESRWNQYADNGRDKGLTQQKAIYWQARAARYGLPGADIFDPYAQLHVYACMMSGYLRATGNDIGMALSLYYYGNGDYAEKYVADVMTHLAFLEEVK